MTSAKAKLYDADRYFIGETIVEVPTDVTVIAWGEWKPEFYTRCPDHENCFVVANGLVVKNGEVAL